MTALQSTPSRSVQAHVPPPIPDVIPTPQPPPPRPEPDVVPPPDIIEPPMPGKDVPVEEPGRPKPARK